MRPARGAQRTVAVAPVRLGGVPRLVPGVAPGFVPGTGSFRVDAGECAQIHDAERREDAPSRGEACVGQGLREAIEAIVIHRCSSWCTLVAA